jgi:hypothetical protein
MTKRWSLDGIEASISSLMTEPRRRRFNADSNRRTRSSASFLHLDVAVAQHPE